MRSSFFVCSQKTAYEMRISDWSSDVCSSDLAAVQLELLAELDRVERINRLVGERSGLDAGRDEIDWAGIDALRIGDADRIIGRRCTVGEALHIDRKSTRLNSSH